MNIKELMELITYLRERYADLTSTRDHYANELEDMKGKPDNEAVSGYLDSCKEKAAKAGIEASKVNYFIMQLERVEVWR